MESVREAGAGQPVDRDQITKELDQQIAQVKSYENWTAMFSRVQRLLDDSDTKYEIRWEAPASGSRPFLDWIGTVDNLLIVAGGLSPRSGVFGKESAYAEILSAASAGRSIRIIFGTPVLVDDATKTNPFIEEILRRFPSELPAALELYSYESGRPPLHCCIADDKVSVEYPHNEWHTVRRRLRTVGVSTSVAKDVAATIFDACQPKLKRIESTAQLVDIYHNTWTSFSAELANYRVGRRAALRLRTGQLT